MLVNMKAKWLIALLLVIAVGCLGQGVHEVVQGKSPESYMGMFLYAAVMPIFAGMVWWMEYRVPHVKERE